MLSIGFHRAICLATSLLAIASSGFPCVTRAEEPQAAQRSLTRVDHWQTAFAEETVAFRWQVENASAVNGRPTWSLATDQGVTLERGDLSWDVPLKAERTVEFSLQLPPVKPGIILPLKLTISAGDDRTRTKLLAEETFWVYPKDPLHERHTWLKVLNITVYDPARKTTSRLNDAQVPFEELSNPSALDAEPGSVVIIGEGISLREERGLASPLYRAASNGAKVLWLAPIEGELPLPAAENSSVPASGLQFANREFLASLDKRLDASFWKSQAVVPSATMKLLGNGRDVAVEVTAAAGDWTWLAVNYPPRGQMISAGKLLVCGLPIIERWEDGPTPRFLFARLLEHLTDTRNPTSVQGITR